jgi:3-deoxy-D-manno-octulosonate 8-phosphate phosphatase (KDO 8-P phosphatase)
MPFDPTTLTHLQAVGFDVDGVLTDGTLTWTPTGEELKRFHFADIMGISLLRRLDVKMALISGEPAPQVDLFAQKLHIPFVVKGTRDKATAVREFAEKFSLDLAHTAFFGDDVNDLFAMELVGIPCCPSNAALEVRSYVLSRAGFVSTRPGGAGAVREFADTVLSARGLTGRNVFPLRPPA